MLRVKNIAHMRVSQIEGEGLLRLLKPLFCGLEVVLSFEKRKLEDPDTSSGLYLEGLQRTLNPKPRGLQP